MSTSIPHEGGSLQQDSGKLPVDVARREAMKYPGRPAGADRSNPPGGDPDEADEESFPASDPPSAWAGPDLSAPDTGDH